MHEQQMSSGQIVSPSHTDARTHQTRLFALRAMQQLNTGLKAREVAVAAFHVRHRESPIVRLTDLTHECHKSTCEQQVVNASDMAA